MKILFVSPDGFPPTRVDVSVLFGKELVGRGHKIDWVLQSCRRLRRGYETKWRNGVALVGPFDPGTSIRSTVLRHIYSFIHDFNIFRLLRHKQYDFILIRDKFFLAIFAIAAARFYGSKFVYWLSFPFPEVFLFQVRQRTARFPIFYWLKGHCFSFLLYRIILPSASHAFVQTDEMKKQIALHGVQLSKMTAVPMAVSTEDAYSVGEEVPKINTRPDKCVVYLGTLAKDRRIDFLLTAFARVLDQDSSAHLYLVGGSDNPQDEEFLKTEAKRLGIDHAVTLTGFLPREEAWKYVNIADVCVSPIYPSPIWDVGSPTKLIEYMALGKAAVANDHPEQQTVIAESGGGICVPYKVSEFAKAILYLLRNPSVAKDMGARGKLYVKKRRNYSKTADLVESRLIEYLG